MHPDSVTYKPSMGKLHNLSGSLLFSAGSGDIESDLPCAAVKHVYNKHRSTRTVLRGFSLFFMVIISIARVVPVSPLTILPGACYLWIVLPGKDAEVPTRSTCDRVWAYFLCW